MACRLSGEIVSVRSATILHERFLTFLSLSLSLSLLHPICFTPSPIPTAKAIYVLSLIGSMTQKMKMAPEESCKVSA
jgi:hypothetical protein